MADEDTNLTGPLGGSRNPFADFPGPLSGLGEGRSANEPGTLGAGASPPPPPKPSRHPATRRRALLAGLVAAAFVVAAACGALVGHALWAGGSTANLPSAAASSPSPSSSSSSSSNPSSGAPSFHSGSGGFSINSGGFSISGGFGNGTYHFSSSSNGTTQSTGSPPAVSAIAAKVDPDLVDIDSTFGYSTVAVGGEGTGIVVSSNGEVVTNNHVIEGATKISAVDVGNGKTYKVTVVGYDPSQDIAVLQLQGASGLQAASFATAAPKVGEGVVAIGNAGGTGGTPTSAGGEVTALNQAITAQDEVSGIPEQLSRLIEINADIQPGDSGGSLVNANGQIIGMDTAASESFFFSTANQGYAIPIPEVLSVAKAAEAGQSSTTLHVGATGFLGVDIEPASSTPLRGFGNPFGGFSNQASSCGQTSNSGLLIAEAFPGEPAARAGLSSCDTITSLDGKPVDTDGDVSKIIFLLHPGDSVTVGYLDTSGKSHTVTLQLGSGPPE